MSIKTQESEKLPLVQHLIELRRSLLHSIIAIVIFFLALFPFADDIYTFIAAPIVQAIPGSNLIAIGVISPFLTPLKMSLILAIYIAMPYLLYQLWMFIAPALYRNERRLVLPLVISSTILFYVGLLFSFYIVFPVIFNFLAGVGPFVVGMVLTPPDVISQFLIAIPIWLLFEAGLFFSSFFKVRKNNPTKIKAEKNQPKDWTDMSHNEMMDDIENEMNTKVIGDSEKNN